MLAGLSRSRLYQALRHDGGETYSPWALELEEHEPGAYVLVAYTRAENRARLEKKLHGVVAALHREGLSEAERQDAVAALQGGLARQGRTAAERLGRLLFERRHGLPPRHREAWLQRAAALSLGEINGFIRRFYDPASFALVSVNPRELRRDRGGPCAQGIGGTQGQARGARLPGAARAAVRRASVARRGRRCS